MILHVLRVMANGLTREERIVGALHKVVQDSDFTIDHLTRLGFTAAIVDAVAMLTAPDRVLQMNDDEYVAFVRQANANPLARRVKLAALRDNCDLTRIDQPNEKDLTRTRRYERAIAALMSGLVAV